MLKPFVCFVLLFPLLAFAEPLDHVVAVVNDGVITASELNKQVETLRQQLMAQRVALPPEDALRKQVLQHLIDVDLELQLAKQYDIHIDDAELNDAIHKIATNNKFSPEELKAEVIRQGLSWPTYKENIRKEMILGRLQQKAIGKDVMVTSQQVEDYLKTASFQDKNQYTYHLQNIVISLPEEPSPEQLAAGQAQARALLARINKGEDFSQLALSNSSGQFALEGGDLGERHLAELPEIFAKEVVKMHANQVVGPLRTGNGLQLIKLIAIQGENTKHEVVKTHVRHILLKQDASTTELEAEKQVKNLYQQLKSGKDFALMAKQYSLDVTSAIKGGDLGWVTPGQLVPEFEKAMDKLPLHQVSKPVKSGFGWHLIEVLERKKVDDSDAFKRQQVRLFLQQRKFTEAVQNWQQHIRGEAYIKVLDKDLA